MCARERELQLHEGGGWEGEREGESCIQLCKRNDIARERVTALKE